MKILKVKVKRIKEKSWTKSIYPEGCACRWLVNEGEIFTEDGVEYQYRIGLALDAVADKLSKDNPDEFEIISQTDAETYAEENEPMPVKITDEKEVIRITQKISNKETTTQEEKDSINKTKDGGAISVGKTWKNIFTESLTNSDIENKLKK